MKQQTTQQPKEVAEQVIGGDGLPAGQALQAVATFDRFLPRSFTELQSFAEIIAKTDFCPKEYKGKPHDVLAVFMFCGELDVKFMQGLYGIFVVNGKPAAYGDLFLAICMHHPDFNGLDEWFDDATNTAHCIAKRRGRTDVHQTFSEEDVVKARLREKTGSLHVTYPRRMKQMRARGFACRDQFADALKGMVIAEEAYDMRDIPGEVVSDIPQGGTASARLLNTLKPSKPEPATAANPATAAADNAEQSATPTQQETATASGSSGAASADAPITAAVLMKRASEATTFEQLNEITGLASRELDPDGKQEVARAIRERRKMIVDQPAKE